MQEGDHQIVSRRAGRQTSHPHLRHLVLADEATFEVVEVGVGTQQLDELGSPAPERETSGVQVELTHRKALR
jgi:hypothetical protein